MVANDLPTCSPNLVLFGKKQKIIRINSYSSGLNVAEALNSLLEIHSQPVASYLCICS